MTDPVTPASSRVPNAFPKGRMIGGERRNLVPVPEQQRELHRIRKLAADGLSPYKISADLATRGVKLSHVTIRKIPAASRQEAA